jgi:hypothetical protein
MPKDVVAEAMPPGVLIWPYQDVPPSANYFLAANFAAMSGIYVPDEHTPDFDADHGMTQEEINRAVMLAENSGFRGDAATAKTRRGLVMNLFPSR